MSRSCPIALLALALCLWGMAESQPIQCYVQLIRGVDGPRPPTPAAKPIGTRLSKCLTSVFRWKNYWEVDRQLAVIKPGKPTRIHLSEARDLDLELLAENQIELRLLRSGVLLRRSRFSAQSKGLEIMGGSQEEDKSWFVVVRQDMPQPPGK